MEITEIFRSPFKAEGAYIFSADNAMALMAADCCNYPDEMMDRIVAILNGDAKPKVGADIGVNGSEICVNGDPVLTVRGWGYLTGTGGLNLSPEEASNIQDNFAIWVVKKLRGEQ